MILSDLLLAWYDNEPQRELPWQTERTLYRVWVSEIMLQQTQANTVKAYFSRFVTRFQNIIALANATLDDVLHLWSGLGYYSRAAQLHRAARIVCEHHDGQLPCDIDALQRLPGIGRSTAGAILVLACGKRHPILDGNVKRILCRYYAIEDWTGGAATQQRLWAIATAHTPMQRVADYTQAIMNLGTAVCQRTSPLCERCPLTVTCIAQRTKLQHLLPSRRPAKTLPLRQVWFVVARNQQGSVLLMKRPSVGIWSKLYSFPECDSLDAVEAFLQQDLGLTAITWQQLTPLKHVFSHYKLLIMPVVINTQPGSSWQPVKADYATIWYALNEPTPPIGIPAPVRRILQQLAPL